MLYQMNSASLICSFLPKLKHQLAFLHARQVLFDATTVITRQEQENGSSSITTSNSAVGNIHSPLSSLSKNTLNEIEQTDMASVTQSTSPPSLSSLTIQTNEPTTVDRVSLPLDYEIPDLSANLMHEIEIGNLKDFGPHRSYRRVLIDTIFFDLTNNFSLW
jgi:hypothetical protein